MIADKFPRHDLRDRLRAGMAAEAAVALQLKQAIGEMRKDDFIQHFREDRRGRNTAAFHFDFKTKPAQLFPVNALVIVIQLDKTIRREILVPAAETLESVVLGREVSAVIAVNVGNLNGDVVPCLFAHCDNLL